MSMNLPKFHSYHKILLFQAAAVKRYTAKCLIFMRLNVREFAKWTDLQGFMFGILTPPARRFIRTHT